MHETVSPTRQRGHRGNGVATAPTYRLFEDRSCEIVLNTPETRHGLKTVAPDGFREESLGRLVREIPPAARRGLMDQAVANGRDLGLRLEELNFFTRAGFAGLRLASGVRSMSSVSRSSFVSELL